MGLFLLNSALRTAAKGNAICPAQSKPTYILCPEIDARASSSLLGPPPLPDGQSTGGLITQVRLFTPWPQGEQSTELKNLGHVHWQGAVYFLKLHIPFLSISFATAVFVAVSELSESGTEDLIVRRRRELVKREGLDAEGDTVVVGLSG